MRRAAYVLVGGRSSRMGRDKALLPYRGTTLAVHAAEAARQTTASVTLVGPARLYGGLGFPVLEDRYPGKGPLGALLTVLESTEALWNLLLACDMPSVDGSLLASLFERAEDCGGDCLAPLSPGGQAEALCAVYHARCREPVEALFQQGVRRMKQALEALHTVYCPMDDALCFENLNTPDDWEAHLSSTPGE
jgi:molybdenum cofactor guanylyltransferase